MPQTVPIRVLFFNTAYSRFIIYYHKVSSLRIYDLEEWLLLLCYKKLKSSNFQLSQLNLTFTKSSVS